MRELDSNLREQTKEPWLQHRVTMIVLEVKVKMKLPISILWLEKDEKKMMS